MKQGSDHSFVVLAYKESPYLEDCIRSLASQSKESNITITTSTPNDHISKVAEKYKLEIKINPLTKGIASDWTFAYQSGQSEFVTLAHQDDLYSPNYTKLMTEAAAGSEENLITFCDYSEIRDEYEVTSNLNLIIKRLMIFPYFMFSKDLTHRYLKKMFLSFGSPVSCPSVMYNKKNIGNFTFSEDFSINLDWDAWLRFASMNGSFTYTGNSLMKHRVHSSSETTAGLRDGKRQAEDLRIFERMWPSFIAKQISRIYSLSYGSNN